MTARAASQDSLLLNSGFRMPLQGFGLYKVPEADAESLVRLAIEAGYRLIDTAAFYGNEAAVGAAVRGAIGDGLVTREELFVTSKLWNDRQGFEESQQGFADSLDRLGLSYLDLFLIHWPCPARGKYLETWRGFEALLGQGMLRSIGVSNFLPEHLARLLNESETVPAVNQVELHPMMQQNSLREFHAAHGIATQAWSPLARGKALTDPTVLAISEAAGLGSAELILRWLRDSGISAIPKASSAARIEQNFRLPAEPLSPQTMAQLAAVERAERVGSNPAEVS